MLQYRHHAVIGSAAKPKAVAYPSGSESEARAGCAHPDSGFPCGLICDSLSAWQIWGFQMGKPHPMALRERVVAFVEEGHSHRAAAARFRVSVKFVNDMVILKRETGELEPRRQGNGGGHGKLARLRDWIAVRITAKPDLTLDDLMLEIAEAHQMTVHRVSVWRSLYSLGQEFFRHQRIEQDSVLEPVTVIALEEVLQHRAAHPFIGFNIHKDHTSVRHPDRGLDQHAPDLEWLFIKK